MSELDLYKTYLSWLGRKKPVQPQHMFDFPLLNRDVYEDGSEVLNHIIYFVPDLTGSVPRGFFFLEENIFTKDSLGELIFQSSSFRLFEG